MRLACALTVLALASVAHAQEGVKRHYVGVSMGGFAGGGFSGLAVAGPEPELTTGLRLSRWVSVEGFFDAAFPVQPYREPVEGAMCSGEWTDQWRWQTFGGRFWVHLAHTREIDFSIAPPSLAIGIAYDQGRSTDAPGTQCFRPGTDRAGAMLVVGLLGVSFELRGEAEWFAVRVSGGAELDLGFGVGLGALSLAASVGPVFRF